jgi:protein-tyrosine-phosphatase
MEQIQKNILVVCMGNTCRSSMAEALLRSLLGEGTNVESAGIETVDHLPATNEAVSVMGECGLDISGHRSHKIQQVNLDSYQSIVAMTDEIEKRLIQLGANSSAIRTLGVEDPYRRGIDVYRATAIALKSALQSLFVEKADE